MQSRIILGAGIAARIAKQGGVALGAVLLLAAPLLADDSAVAKYLGVLKSGDQNARVAAIDSLGQLGPVAAPAVSALVDQLGDPSEVVRAHAAHALMQIGPAAKDAAAALAKGVGDSDYHVRRMSVAALERIHPDPAVVVEALGKALEDADPSVRIAALHTLTDYSDAAVPVLSKALENTTTRYWAALALGEMGSHAKSAVPALAKSLSDERPEVRRELLIALARLGAEAAPAVEQITPLLKDKEPTVAHAAGYALGSIGPPASGAVPALKAAIDGQDKLEDCVNSWAIARIEPRNPQAREEAIKLLLETIKDKNPRVQTAAIRGLIDLKAPAKQAVPALAYVVLNGEEPAVGDALAALAMMGDESAAVLAEALARPEARARAALLVTYLGPKAKAAVPALAKALDDKDPDVRREVLFALAAVGPDASEATPKIVEELVDPNQPNRAVAAFTLGKIGPAAKTALANLQGELKAEDPLLRVASAFALVNIAPENEALVKAALPALVEGLDSPVAAARRGAAEALGQVGKPARAVAEKSLQAALVDSDETVRRAALEALEKMGVVVDAPAPRQAKPLQKR